MFARSPANRVLTLVVLALAGIATAHAIVRSHWDAAATLLLLDAALIALVMANLGSRRPVQLRLDLVRWLEQRSARLGEPVESLADQAVASYRQRCEPIRSDKPTPAGP